MLKDIYKDVIKDFGTRTYNDIESRKPEVKSKFDFLTDDIQRYITSTTADKVVLITETTKKLIKIIVGKAIAEGKSIPETEDLIDKLYLDQIIPNRSRTIARTEVVSASNYGSIAGAKQTSPKLFKVWIPTFDDSTRETHLTMANHPPIGLDEQFNVGGYYAQQPGDFSLPASEVINCRCAIGYEYAPVQPQTTLVEQPQIEQPTEQPKAPEQPPVIEQPKIIQDPLLPDEVAKVKRGNPMTREEANHARPNPNYRKSLGYQENCQTCVVAYEARLRGYDVSAKEFKNGSKLEELARKTNLAWIDPATGGNPAYIFNNETTNPKKFLKFMDDTVQTNARYTLQFSWKGRGRAGHIISLDRDENGGLRLYDPQTSKTYTGAQVESYIKQFKYQTTLYGTKVPRVPKMLRVDDKQFNPDFTDNILERVLP